MYVSVCVWLNLFGELITTSLCVNCGVDSSIMTNLLVLYSSNVHVFVMYLIVYVILVCVWGLRDIMNLYLYFLPLECPLLRLKMACVLGWPCF